MAANQGPKGKPSKSNDRRKQLAEQQARAKAAREALMAKQRRQRLLFRVGAPIAAVIVIVAVFIIVKVVNDKSSSDSGSPSTPAPAAVTTALSSIPASAFDTVGAGSGLIPLTAITGDPLTSNGKPELLYVGAEFCPYCAGERWAVVAALNRFGSFTGLGVTHSASADVYPNTATLSFHGSAYTSQYVAFVGKEIETNIAASGGGYTALDTLDASQQALFTNLGKNSFPFLDLGGKYISSTQYKPDALSGKTQQEIADALKDPTTDIAKTVLPAANKLSAAICQLTSNQPAAVCTSAGVKAAAAAGLVASATNN